MEAALDRGAGAVRSSHNAVRGSSSTPAARRTREPGRSAVSMLATELWFQITRHPRASVGFDRQGRSRGCSRSGGRRRRVEHGRSLDLTAADGNGGARIDAPVGFWILRDNRRPVGQGVFRPEVPRRHGKQRGPEPRPLADPASPRPRARGDSVASLPIATCPMDPIRLINS